MSTLRPGFRLLIRPLLTLQHPQAVLMQIRPSSSSSSSPSESPFGSYPSPPRLPPSEQAEFERLQRKAGILPPDPSDLLSYIRASSDQQIPANIEITSSSSSLAPDSAEAGVAQEAGEATLQAKSTDPTPAPATETSSGGLFRGAPPEFEGDVNPKTGEVGGPKNEPLRWGGQSDWSYNGRVTDF